MPGVESSALVGGSAPERATVRLDPRHGLGGHAREVDQQDGVGLGDVVVQQQAGVSVPMCVHRPTS